MKAFLTGFAFLVIFATANWTLGSTALHPALTIALLAFAGIAFAATTLVAKRLWNSGGADSCPTADSNEAGVFFVAIILATLTSFAYSGIYFFIGWPPISHGVTAFLRSGVVLFALLTPVAALVFQPMRRKGWTVPLLALLLIASELLAAAALIRFTGFGPIYTDDHPSFLFRVAEFWGSFPWRENYVPHWNAGVVNSVLTSSGIPGYALFSAPLHLVFRQPHLYHTTALIAYHVVFTPWLAIWGFRACRHDWATALTGGVLALFANKLFFIWTLRFGTVGAAVSWAATPAAILFAYAIAEEGRTDWRTVAGLALSASLLCAWPQMWLFAAIVGLAVLTSCRSILGPGKWRRAFALAVAGAIAMLLTAHSLVAAKGSKDLMEYVSERPDPVGGLALLAASWKMFRLVLSKNLVAQANPLVLVFGLAGLLTLRPRPMRRWIALILVLSAVIFSAGASRYPNMQLYRMAIPFAMVLAVPAAIQIGGVWRQGSPLAAPLQGAVAMLLIFGAINTARIYHAEDPSPFDKFDPTIKALADWVSETVPEGSRVAFAGRTSHAYGHAHIAYLPILTGREMMACDYYEFPPGTYEPDFPPAAARGQEGGIHAYLLEHRVTHVITCRPNYIDFFESNPDQYEPGPRFLYRHATGSTDIRTFAVKGPQPDDAGVHAKATFNRIEVDFDATPPESVVLAYHWHDRLVATPPAEILPKPTATPGEVPFIELRPNGSSHVSIKYRSRF